MTSSMSSTLTDQQAKLHWDAGWRSYRAGVRRDDGPAIFGSEAVRLWQLGWDDHQREDLKVEAGRV